MDAVVLGVISVAVAALSGVLSEWNQRRAERQASRTAVITLSGDGNAIRESDSFTVAGDVAPSVEDIRIEVDEDREVQYFARPKASRAHAHAVLDEDALVTRITRSVREEIRIENKRAFWVGAAQGFVFYLLGVGTTLLIG